jgi:hypothetical protein
MFQHIDENDFAGLLYCLSALEQIIFQFYKCLHEKVKQPLMKPLLLYIANDCKKTFCNLKGTS